MKRKILGSLLMVIGSSAFAQATSQLEVSANVQAGCNLTGQDINFGVINVFENNNQNINKVGNINLHCSKGTTVSLSQEGKFGAQHNNRVYLNGEVTEDTSKFMEYDIWQPADSDIPAGITLSRVTPSFSEHNIYGAANSGHTVTIVMNTSDDVTIPLRGVLIGSSVNSNLLPGDYSDSVTYSVTF